MDITGLRFWLATNGRDLSTLSPRKPRPWSNRSAVRPSSRDRLQELRSVQAVGHDPATIRRIGTQWSGFTWTAARRVGRQGDQGGRDQYYVAVWQAENGNQPMRVYEDHTYIPMAVALSPDRSLVASGDFLGEIHVWEVATGQRRLKVLTGDGQAYYKVAFDASGRRLAFGSVPHTGTAWYYNHYADPERTFDLERRRIVDGYSGQLQTELTRKDDMELKAVRSGNSVGLAWYRSGQLVNSYAARNDAAVLLDPPLGPTRFCRSGGIQRTRRRGEVRGPADGHGAAGLHRTPGICLFVERVARRPVPGHRLHRSDTPPLES